MHDEPKTVDAVVPIIGYVTPKRQIAPLEAQPEGISVGAPVFVPAHSFLGLKAGIDRAVDGDQPGRW